MAETIETLFAQAVEQQNAGNVAAAIALYRRILTVENRYAVVHANLGAALMAMSDARGAVTSYRRALALDPDLFPGAQFARFGMRANFPADQVRALLASPNFQAADTVLLAFAYTPRSVRGKGPLFDALDASGKRIILRLNPPSSRTGRAGACSTGMCASTAGSTMRRRWSGWPGAAP